MSADNTTTNVVESIEKYNDEQENVLQFPIAHQNRTWTRSLVEMLSILDAAAVYHFEKLRNIININEYFCKKIQPPVDYMRQHNTIIKAIPSFPHIPAWWLQKH